MKMETFTCEKCGQPSEEVGCKENDWCMDCYEEWFASEWAYWKPLYDGEKQAGLLDDKD